MLTIRIASSWRRDRTNMFLRSFRIRNALLKTNWSLFSRCEAVLIEYYATCVCLRVATCVSTWSSMLIVANVLYLCYCFIVILIFFWFWCVLTSSKRRFLVVSRVTLTVYKYSLLRCLRSRYSEFFCVLIFIEVLNLRRANVSSRMLSKYVLILFDSCLISLIELFWVMFDCLSTLCRLCLYTRSQQRISRQDVSLSLLVLSFRHDESTLFRRLSNAWRILSLFLRRSLWLRHFFRSRSNKLFISSSIYQLRVVASLSHRCCLSWL